MFLWEVTGKGTIEAHRGMGPGTWRKTHEDNVGKDQLPVGTGDNLQRPAVLGTTEVGGRVLVWRMSAYER